ncbi:hypothetical protein [Aliiroseovarius subalbicans]|uniref:hypothetical protein n=1 Tax=Aliiroseovarius subalbicans TaxID=2925840 RepID=UPI001F56671C|nr:hypothetical protein [Aliiroseovarius subalbicans]MCI2399497.1 hypothetical protein [Aliiroseovarius subalbicans]
MASELTLTKTRIQAGFWEGVLTVSGEQIQPQIEVTHLTQVLDGVDVSEDASAEGRFTVRVPIPVDLLTDGVQTFVISDRDSGERLESFSVITGQPMEDDIRAEVDLLRAELDMLKRAFRRHCLETM